MGTLVNAEYNLDLRYEISFLVNLQRTIAISDAGDIPEGLSLEDAHDALRRKVSEIISNGGIPFVIGGGNDQSYPNASGWMMSKDQGSVPSLIILISLVRLV
jgi:formiminoglutamase